MINIIITYKILRFVKRDVRNLRNLSKTFFFTLKRSKRMFPQTTGNPVSIALMGLAVLLFVHQSLTFDQCDIHHKFVVEKGKTDCLCSGSN